MSTSAQQGTGDPDEVASGRSGTNGVPPLADDRPFVDGTTASPEQLRAEVERLSNEERQHVDDLREEVGDSLAELASRFDVKARIAGRKDEAVAAVHQRVDRARHVAAERATAARGTASERPGLVAGVAAALLVVLVVVLRRRRG